MSNDYTKALNIIESSFRSYPIDWAQRVVSRADLCRLLGMMGEAKKASTCIREGFEEGSYMHPFLEHYLPFYDPIRASNEFTKVVVEIDADIPHG